MEREPHYLTWENAKHTSAIVYGRTDYRQMAILWMNIYSRRGDIYEGLSGSFAHERADNLYLPALEDDEIICRDSNGAWEFVKDLGPSFQFSGGGEMARIERARMAATAGQEVASEFNLARAATHQRSAYLRLSGQALTQYLTFLDKLREQFLDANSWESDSNESATMDLVFLALVNSDTKEEAKS